jgi:hypothetical protein
VRTSIFCVTGALVVSSAVVFAQPSPPPQGRGAAKQAPTKQAAPAPAATPPQIVVAGLKVIGSGLGANGSELEPFHDHPGTFIALAIQPPKGSGIVAVDDDTSKLEAFTDDKGASLLEEGRVGPFPKVAEDGSAALVEVEVRGRPTAGAAALTVRGTLALTLANGSKATRVANLKLEDGQTFKVGTTTMTVNSAKAADESTNVTFGLPRSVLQTLRETRFFDSKNQPLEARRTSSGYMNQKAEVEFDVKTKDKVVTVEFELWQNARAIKAPFTVQAGLGSVPNGRAADTSAGASDKPSSAGEPAKPKAAAKPAGPPPAIGPTEGAASVEAVVKQMQTAAVAGKASQVIAVIYPTDRLQYGQGVAMALAFSTMGALDKPDVAEKQQKELDGLYAKHHLTAPFTRDPDDLFKATDLAAFVGDAFAFLKSHAAKGDKPEDYLPVPSGKPEDVKIDADTATATLSGKDVTFARISGKWFIRL